MNIRPKTHVLALILIIVLSLITVSCTKEAVPAPEETGKPLKGLAKLSMMVPLHQEKAPPASLMSELQARTGVELDIQWIPDDIYSNKFLNALETNTPRQVVFVKPVDFTAVKSAIRSNMFWSIGPYLDHYPNLKTLNKAVLEQTAVDGKIYGLYNERPESRQGLIIRKDWLDRLGMKAPTNLEELYQVMKAFTDKDPDGNGKADTLGLTDRNDLYYGAFKTLSSYFGTPNSWSIKGDTFVPEFDTPEYMDTMNYMKKLYNENIINKDFPVTSKSVQRYMMLTGKAGIYIGSLADAPRMQEEMKQVNSDAEVIVLNRIQGPKGYGVWSIPGYNGLFLFSKKAIPTEDALKQTLAFFNRSMDKDVSNLMLYGIENKHYILKNGLVSSPSPLVEKMNNEVKPLLSLMVSNINNPNLLKLSPEGMDPLVRRVDELVADNSSFLIRDPSVGLSSDTYDARSMELNAIISNATYNYILGKIDAAGFRNEVAIWKQRGGAQVIQELSDAYRLTKAAK
ncbi:extracellular solute-binding protein [Gorillibacterium sp. sgz5001074]|uniref:extracellular solute-binding protein n=1 Tax=Gorillibacterium sp. sgz5001074 TaxID=3446695 RepID=UPI003F6697D5